SIDANSNKRDLATRAWPRLASSGSDCGFSYVIRSITRNSVGAHPHGRQCGDTSMRECLPTDMVQHAVTGRMNRRPASPLAEFARVIMVLWWPKRCLADVAVSDDVVRGTGRGGMDPSDAHRERIAGAAAAESRCRGSNRKRVS